MFVDWYAADVPQGPGGNAWQSFTVIDVFLALAGAMGVGLFSAAATQRSPAVAQGMASMTVIVAFIASVLVLIRLLDPPGWESVVGPFKAGAPPRDLAVSREAGVYLGVAATLAVLFSAWRSVGDERFPRAAVPDVEVTPLPAPKARTEPSSD
jgi:hypothetical protein